MTHAATLQSLLEGNDALGLEAFLQSLSERERHALAPSVLAATKAFDKTPYADTPERWAARDRLRLAAWWTCGRRELGHFAKETWLSDEALAVFRARRPDWLPDAAQIICAASPYRWSLVRGLVREGLSRVPESDHYILSMFARFTFGGRGDSLAAFLLDDPGLLESEIWRLFEVEGGGELSLAAHDKYPKGQTWSAALGELSAAGFLPRERLLDASLSALARDFAAFRAGWFARFHESLSPTPDERQARRPAYLRLLGSAIPATVSFAIKALTTIERAQPLLARDLLPHIGPVLLARQQGAALAALDLLGRLAARETGAALAIARTATVALAHPEAAVQAAALDLIEATGVAGEAPIATAIAEQTPRLAPSVRQRLSGAVSISEPVAAPPRATASPLDPDRRLAALANLDALLDGFARVLEDDGDPDLIERVLQGLARWGADRPADFARRTGPLRKRAHTLWARPWSERQLAWAMAGVALIWLGDLDPTAKLPHESTGAGALFIARAWPVARAAREGKSSALLSTPTHRQGFLDPLVLVERAAAGGTPVSIHDPVLALLRLAPVNRGPAREAARALPGEFGAAVRHALGETVEVGPTAPLWVAAARARAPGADDPAVEAAHPGLGPDAGRGARYTWEVRPWTYQTLTAYHLHLDVTPARQPLDPAFPSVGLHQGDPEGDQPPGLGREFSGTLSELRWAATLWPTGTEAFFAPGCIRVGNNLDWWEASWPDAAFLEVLDSPFTAFGPLATLLLALGLAAKEPGQAGLAVEAAIGALGDGRLAGSTLGAVMATLLPSKLVKAARFAKTLGTVAATSPLHARQVTAALQAAFRGDPTQGPRDEGRLVNLLRELLIGQAARITDAEAWAYLSHGRHRRALADVSPV